MLKVQIISENISGHYIRYMHAYIAMISELSGNIMAVLSAICMDPQNGTRVCNSEVQHWVKSTVTHTHTGGSHKSTLERHCSLLD